MRAHGAENDLQAGAVRRSPAEAAQNGFAAWNSGDCESFLATIHPEVVWKTARLFPGLRSEYSGHDGMRTFWDEFQEPWETLRIETKRIVEPDESSALILFVFHARGRDGIEVELEFVNHMVIRDGMLYRYRGFARWDEALAELGIDESELESD